MSRSLPLAGMTLIELMVTMVILGLLTVLIVPAFRNFQGRQDLLVDQEGVQSLLYRMQNLALAPLDSGSNIYDVAGYGLIVLPTPRGSNPTVTIGTCTISATSDILALVTIAKFTSDGSINDFLTGIYTPTSSTTGNCVGNGSVIDPTRYPDTFFTLSSGVQLSTSSSPSLPWLIVQPLNAVQSADGSLCSQTTCSTSQIPGLQTVDFTNPATAIKGAALDLKYGSIRDATNRNNFLCRQISFSEDANVVIQGTVVAGGCL